MSAGMRLIQKACMFPITMPSRAWLMLVVFLFLSAPLTTVAKTSGELPAQQESDVASVIGEEERLELASAHWHMMPTGTMEPASLTAATGLLHLASGSFDPTLSNGPELPEGFARIDDEKYTGTVLLQLHAPDGVVLGDLVERYELTVLDNLPDEAWVVRLPENGLDVLPLLGTEDSVRWLGAVQPGWRVSPVLLDHATAYEAIAIVPTPDLGMGGYGMLASDIVSYGAKQASCDAWMCYASLEPSSAMSLILHLAHDGRVLWTEPTASMRVHNAVALSIAGVQAVQNSASFTLDGSGEMFAIADTGLDQNHPDIDGRVLGPFTQFGLDPSPADTNSGHGTHIAVSVLGNGSGDAAATGVAPEANLVMYALEHDPTGTFGRIGSIYDMLRDAEQMTARVSVNAWGLNGNYGQYTADARSVDTFVHDKKDLTPVFSVGDRGSFGASQVSSPATGKNVIAVGASTTGVTGTPAAGAVVNFSSLGPALDGRIKPDVVAPGVGVCSGLAEEAQSPAGASCLTGNHAGGNAYYMTLSGTSQATAIASGVAGLTREFIREQVGIAAPSSALVKAAMINGATDLGAADIPNAAEGWGEVNLERTVLPMDGTTVLDTFVDDKKTLSPGFGLLYSFSIDPSHGLDMTLAWTDEAGSAIASQTESRLVNDLDLVLVGPDGTEWLGNDFSQGYSTTGGTADDLNNVERIRVAPGVLPAGTDNYIIKVMHRGGTAQDFALVLSAVATATPQPDLAVFDGSILLSSENPLKDDLISIRLAWVNQGTTSAAPFDIILEDVTTQTVLATATRPTLAPGVIDSYTIFHQFATTGIHTLRVSVDTGGTVDEINDGLNGVNNNVWTQDVEVMALGVRVVVENEDGTVPTTSEERATNALMTLDVRNDSGIDVPLSILHEGTGNQSVVLSATMVQVPVPGRDNFFLPSPDMWTRTFNETTAFLLSPQGEVGANKSVNLRLEDIDADLTSDPSNPRYVRSGTYVVEITARYEYQPTVAHTQRITIEVEQLDQVQVVAAGTSGLEAVPGESAVFSISVRNTGNAPAQYSIDCDSEQRWQVMLGSSNSSQLDFEPLNILEYLPMSVRVYVPLVAAGAPAAGDTDTVTCYVTSLTDPTMNFTETVTVTVLAQESFEVHLNDDDGPLGPTYLANDVAVDSGQEVHMNMTVVNTGNIEIGLDVSVLPDNPQWAIQISHENEQDSRRISLTLGAGQTTNVRFIFAVPLAAEEGDSNGFTIRTERSLSNFRQNITTLVVKEELGVLLTPPVGSTVEVSIADTFTYCEFTVRNTGNTNLILNWSHGLAPDGWMVGFAKPTVYLEPREEKVVRFGLVAPAQTPAGVDTFELLINVNASNGGRYVEASQMLSVDVASSTYGNLTAADTRDGIFEGVPRDGGRVETFLIRNDGNLPLSGELVGTVVDKNGVESTGWEVSLSPSSVSDLAVGESVEVLVTLTPGDDVERGSSTFYLNLTTESVPISSIQRTASVEISTGSTGLFNVLPPAVSVSLVSVLLVLGVVLARRMKRSGEIDKDDPGVVAPNAHERPDTDGERRDKALDLGTSIDDLTSGEVSDQEIAEAIMQSMDLPAVPAAVPQGLPPSGMPPKTKVPKGLPPLGMPPQPVVPVAPAPLPTPLPAPVPSPVPAPAVQQGPPLPPSGLPAGWTMEQWRHYGHEWLRRQG